MLRPRARSTAWGLPRAYAALLDRWQEQEANARTAERVCIGCGHTGPESWQEFTLWRRHGHRPRESDRALCPDCFTAQYLPYTGQRTGETYSPKARRQPSPKAYRCTRCAVRPALVWDHCHDHMMIRGPLCGTCNGAAAERRSARTADGLRYLMTCPSCRATGMLPPRTLVDLAQDAATNEGCPYGKSHPPSWRSGGGSTVKQLHEELTRTGAVTVTSMCGDGPQWNTVYRRAQLEAIARERFVSLLGMPLESRI
nr:endonuclease domain-containing protein [Streptomyces coryli]